MDSLFWGCVIEGAIGEEASKARRRVLLELVVIRFWVKVSKCFSFSSNWELGLFDECVCVWKELLGRV